MIRHRCKGSLSVDFLFSITISCLLLIFVILTSLTFSLVEVAQYVAYSTARTYFIGHANYDEHTSRAEERFNDLRGKFFKEGEHLSDWFFLSELSIHNNGVKGIDDQIRTRFGVGFTFTSKVLTMNIPFLGDVGESGGSSTGGFDFPIAAFLGREVSVDECKKFVSTFAEGGNGC